MNDDQFLRLVYGRLLKTMQSVDRFQASDMMSVFQIETVSCKLKWHTTDKSISKHHLDTFQSIFRHTKIMFREK